MKAGGKRVVTRHRQSSQSDKTEHVVDEDFPEQEVLVSHARGYRSNLRDYDL